MSLVKLVRVLTPNGIDNSQTDCSLWSVKVVVLPDLSLLLKPVSKLPLVREGECDVGALPVSIYIISTDFVYLVYFIRFIRYLMFK